MNSEFRSPTIGYRSPTGISPQVKLVLMVAVLALGVASGYIYQQHLRYRHFAVHDPGQMYRSAWVSPDVMRELIERYKIRTVVNLCTPGETGECNWELERVVVRRAGARFLELPLPRDLNYERLAITPHLAVLQDSDNYPILVHCNDGLERTSLFITLYDMTVRGITAEKSLETQPLFGQTKQSERVREFCRRFVRDERLETREESHPLF